MPLNFNGYDKWNNGRGEELDYITDSGWFKPFVPAIISDTLWLGMPDLTDKTFEEFWDRNIMLHRILGYHSSEYTKAELLSMVGLHTNADRLTRAAFNKKAVQMYWDGVMCDRRNEELLDRESNG